MEKFKPTVISKEFISSVTDSVQNQNAISFAESVASSSSLSDDQAMNNNYQKSQSYSRDVTGIVTGYKNADTNTIVANVKVSNQSLSADVNISTIMIFANYNGNKILVATSRLNEPELLPAFDADKGTPVTIELAVYIQVSNVVDAKVQFNDAGLATNSDLQHVDSMSVHNIGNETIDGVKTFTQPIKGVADINVRQLWDGYDIDKLKTTGFYVGNYIKVLQSSVKENFSLLVENAGNSSSVKQTKVVFYQNGEIKTLVRYFTGTWSLFTEVPTDDTRLVHNSGDEAISGLKTFNDDAVFNKNVTVTGNLRTSPGQKIYHSKVTLQPNLDIDLYRIGNIILARFGGRGVTISSWTQFDGKIPLGYRPAFFTSASFSVDANIHTVNVWEDGGVYNRFRDGNDSGGVYHDADGSSIWFTKDDYPE
ncbi:hypothetical protein R82291_FJPPFKPJ_00678 [Fructobacillus cardui]|uniref:hypothetical protein n=1 Tax=Fructobacillus cardui TaxID=2893170 RepID=UPI002DA1B6A0|nr:hypothetical protein R82291_FJPPFKPJ_00678 [Fructobacillus cardui]